MITEELLLTMCHVFDTYNSPVTLYVGSYRKRNAKSDNAEK